MADTNEEQLLTELLRRIAREDARLDAVHLEARVMEAASAGDHGPPGRLRQGYGAQEGGPYLRIRGNCGRGGDCRHGAWIRADDAQRPERHRISVTRDPYEPCEPVRTPRPATYEAHANRHAPPTPTTARPTRPTRPTNPTRPTLADEFVPLMPMTEQDLAGPFQLVRVQMPRASLGALRSPLEHPNELVEADVLLGEDGMARAIRVSASGSVYPWRSR